jgi:hypothetical protein
MKSAHLALIIPDKRLHIFQGYLEIIETIQWGLGELGYQTSFAVNGFDATSTNIVFGAQMLALDTLRTLPPETIIYNLEQMAGLDPAQLRDSMKYCGEHFQIWDYSEFNIPVWQRLNPARPPAHVPVGYAPILTRIEKPEHQEIEVLFYGGVGGQRLRVFHDLCMNLVKTVYVHGLYGQARDQMIANSKIVLNINQYPEFSVFEVARVSYLLANSKAVVSDYSADSKIESDLRDAVRFCSTDRVVEECLRLLNDDAARTSLERNGFEIMRQRDIRGILKNAAVGI